MSLLATNKTIHVCNLIPYEFCKFFTHVLLRHADLPQTFKDPQAPNALTCLSSDVMFETLQEYLWPTIEKIIGEELLPTYAYARLYHNEDELKPHKDRPSCEVSVTIQLARSNDYIWPIYMEDKQYLLNEGDAVIYLGTELEHWRNVCAGPDGYYSGQVFLHYVYKNGPYSMYANDTESRKLSNVKEAIYIKNRVV
jgi:hypothetical protein